MVLSIGIDLGTTYTCGAVKLADNNIVIINDSTLASYVAFIGDKVIIGEDAKKYPLRAIYDVKRLIGRSYDDAQIKEDRRRLPYKITNVDDNINICAEYKNQKCEFAPEQLSALLLQKIKEDAEKQLGNTIENAVITVPAHFNNAQRSATVNAATIAGLKVLRIMDEPTAAALAYGLQKNIKNLEDIITAIVIDIGGGTTDLSILNLCMNTIEVLAIAGDPHFGGQEFDHSLVKYCITKFAADTNITINPTTKLGTIALEKLRAACEGAKIELADNTKSKIVIPQLYEENDFELILDAKLFKKITLDNFSKITNLLDTVIDGAGIGKDEIDEIILVGGSTKIVEIQKLISEYFGGKKLNKELDPDKAVAIGAAINAYNLCAGLDEQSDSILLMDVTPLSLGIETAAGIMDVIIPRGTTKPAVFEREFTTYNDNQSGVTIKVYEGERTIANKNNLLGKLQLSGILPAPRGIPRIKVEFKIDSNGILVVSAKDAVSNNLASATIQNRDLSSAQMEQMIMFARDAKNADTRQKNIIKRTETLKDYIYMAQSHMTNEEDTNLILTGIIADIREFLDLERDIDELDDKIHKISAQCNAIFTKLYQNREST